VIRAIAPFLAASTGMRLRGFLPWSLLGTGLWSASFVLVGYAFSASVDQATGVATAATLVYHAISLWVPAVCGAIAFVFVQKAKRRPVVLRNPPEELQPRVR
jgi:undecaprenyl-diphosphatase